jgi:MFS family permease
MTAEVQTQQIAPVQRVSAPSRNYILIILMLSYACALLDRSVMNMVMPQLKREFHFADAELGLLSGFAFTTFFVIFGLPMAVLADRKSRRGIIAISIALWSAMTAVCGLAGSLTQLALCRIGVSVGEAGLAPAAQSMISDLFPKERRGFALSVYSAGVAIGAIVGLAGGGYLAQHFGWRRTFFILALPGVVLSALVALTVREPVRGLNDRHLAEDLTHGSFLGLLRHLWSTPALRYVLVAITFCSLFSLGRGAWSPSFLVRTHHMTIARAGLILGLAGGVGGFIGTIASGPLADYFGAKDTRWRAWVPAVATGLLPATSLVFLYTTDVSLIAAMSFLGSVLAAVHLAPTSAIIQDFTPPKMRARAVAVTVLLINLVGGGLGPYVVGALSDHFHASLGVQSLRYALIATTSFSLISAAFYVVAGLTMSKEASEPT